MFLPFSFPAWGMKKLKNTDGGKIMQLQKMRHGKRDQDLARAVCTNIAETTPPTEIPANPLIQAQLNDFLRARGIKP